MIIDQVKLSIFLTFEYVRYFWDVGDIDKTVVGRGANGGSFYSSEENARTIPDHRALIYSWCWGHSRGSVLWNRCWFLCAYWWELYFVADRWVPLSCWGWGGFDNPMWHVSTQRQDTTCRSETVHRKRKSSATNWTKVSGKHVATLKETTCP
jgi:hypothetical protein